MTEREQYVKTWQSSMCPNAEFIFATLRNSDYAGMARALGLHGERVETPEQLRPAIQRALQNAPALVDVVTSQTVMSSDASKGLGFVPDYQALTAWDDAERKRRQEG